MAWSAVNNFLDLFRTQNEEGIPISDEAKDVGNPNDLECTTNENMPLAKHVKGGDLAELPGEVDSDIASQSDSTDELDDSDESVTIAVDDIAKAGNSVSGSQPIYVDRISSVFTIRSNPCSPLQRRKLFTRTKSEDTGASFSSSTSSDLNLSKSEPLSSSVDQILEANFPFRRDRLLDLLKSVKKNEEVEDQKVEKEYNEGKRIEYKVERFVSRSKANISAQLLSDDSDVTTVLSDESFETCECDLEPSSSEAESVGGNSEPTEEQEELQDVRLDRFLENLSDTSEQNQLEEEFYENNSLIDFLNETKDGVDGTSADEKRNDTSVSPMMIILDGNQKNCKEDSKDNDAQNVLLEEHPIIQSGNCGANVIELKFLLRDAVKRTETERMVSKQATLMQEDVKKEQLDAEDNILSIQHRLKVKPASSEINNVDKALKFEKQGELMDHNTKSQSEHQRKGEDSSYEELNLEKPNSVFQEHCRDMQGNSQTFEEDRTKLDGGNHQQPDYQKIMMRQHIAEKERKENDLFVVEESKLDPKDSQKHDLFINEENYNIFNDDNNFTETDNQVSNLMIPNMESEQLVPDEMEKLCHISVEPNIANEPTLHDKSFTGNDVKNKIMTSQHEYCNPDNLERDNLDQGKVFLLKGNNEPCQLKEDEIKVSEYDIQEMEENKVVPLDQNQTSEHNEEIRKVSVWGKQKDLIEHGNEIHEMNGREQCSNKINKTELEHEFVIISEPCNDREGSASKILDPIGSGQRKLGIIESEKKIIEVQKQKEKLIQHDCVATLVDLSADFTHNQPDQNKYGQEKLEMIEKSPEMQVFDPIKSSTVKNSEKYDFDASSAFIDRSGKTVTTAQSEMYGGTKFKINIQNIESENVETSAIVLEKIVEETNKDYEECTVELQVSAECDDQLANCRKLDTLCDMEMKSTNQENKCLIGEPSDAEKQDSTKLFEVTDDLGAELCDKPSSSKKDIQNLNESQNDEARDICVEIRESDFPVKQAPPKIVKLIPIKVKDFENIVTVSGQTKMDLKAVHPDHGEERLGSTRIQERGLEFVSNTELHISEREDQGLDISSLKTIEASKDIKKINYKDGKASTKIAKRNSEQAAHLKWSQTDLKSQDETLTSAERGKTAVESEKVVKDYGLETNDTDVKQINSLSYSSARKTGYDYSHAHPSTQATSESGDKNLIGLPLKISAKLSNDGIIQDDVRAMKASDEITIDAVSSLKDSGGIKHDDLTSLTASDEITIDAVRSLKDSGGIKHDDLTSPKVSDVKKPDRMAGVESSHNGKRSATVEGLQFYETRVKPDKDNAFYSPARRIKEGGTTDLNISDNAIQEDYMGATGLKSATDRIKKDEVLCLKASADENHHDSATVPDSSTGKDIRPDEVIGRSVVPDSSVGKVIKHDAAIGRSVIPDSSVGKVIKHDAVIGRSVVPESPASKDIKHDDIIGRSVVPDSSAGKDIKHDDVIGRSAAADGIKKDGVAGLKASPDATLMETLSHAVDAAAFDVSEAPQQRPHDDGGSDSFQHCQPPKRAKKNFAAVSAVSSFDLSHYRKYVRESSRKALDTSKDVAVISSYALEKRESGFDLEDKENIECIHTDLQTSIAENLSEFCEEHSEDGTKSHENSSKFCVKTTRQRSSINVKIALFNKERERIIADSSRREGHCHNKSCNKTNQNIEDLIASDKYEITDNTSCSDDSKLALMITDKVCSDSDDRTTQTDQNKHTKKVYTKDKSSTTAKRIIKKVQRSVTRVLSPNNEKKPEEQFVFPTNCVTRVLSPQKEKRPEEQSVDPAMLIPSSESVQSMMPGRVSSTIASTPPSTSPPELMKVPTLASVDEVAELLRRSTCMSA